MQRMRRKIILNIGELQHQSEEVHGRLASYTEEIALGCWRRRPCITHTDTLYLCVAAAAALLSQLNISNLANAKEAKRCNRNESDGKKKIRNEEQITICLRFMWNVSSSVFLNYSSWWRVYNLIQRSSRKKEILTNSKVNTQCGHRFERKILTCNLQFIDL